MGGLSKVIWITGLSGAGKTTLANTLVVKLRAEGQVVVQLDGDELREVFGTTVSNTQNHGLEGRLALAMQYAYLCRLIASQGVIVVISTISLFRRVHAWNRKSLPGYFEVYLKVPLAELRRRDPKSIYSRFEAGELSNVVGLDLSFDEPEAPDLMVEFSNAQTPPVIAEIIMIEIRKQIR